MTNNTQANSPKNATLLQRRAALSPAQREALQRRMKGAIDHPRKDQAIARGFGSTAPMSLAQQGQWILWQLDRSSTAYHVGGGLLLDGVLDADALRYSVNALTERHEALRTVFAERAGGRLEQVILESLDLGMIFEDFSPLGDAERTSRHRQVIIQVCGSPFDLEKGPLLRIALLKMTDRQHQLILLMHHIISDAWSVDILLTELAQLYSDSVAGVVSLLPPPDVRYADFAQWQQQWLTGAESERQLTYWCDCIGTNHTVLDLPSNPASEDPECKGSTLYDIAVPAVLVDSLRARARQSGATFFMVLASALHALLFRYTDQSEIKTGVPVANRHRPETAKVIGCFINTVILKTHITHDLRLTDLLSCVREAAIGAQENQEMPLERVIEALRPPRSGTGSPMFQVFFNHLQPTENLSERWHGLEVKTIDFGERETPFELTVEVIEHDNTKVHVQFSYPATTFDARTIERMAGHYLKLLQAIAKRPEQRVGDVELLNQQEQLQLQRWGIKDQRYAPVDAVHRVFEHHAQTQPQATALIFEAEVVSYDELNRRANRLAHHLIERGVGIEANIGIALQRSVDMVVALLGVLKAGAAYVPLDPDYPSERLAYMIADSGIALLLTQSALRAQLPLPATLPVLALDTVTLDKDATTNPAVALHDDNLAYVIYTSGSTGKPKGVAVSQRVFAQHMQVTGGFFNLAPHDRMLQFATINFDAFVEQLFAPLTAGASIVLRANDVWDSETFYRELLDKRITTVDLTTAYATVLVQEFGRSGKREYGALRQLHVGGEALSPQFPALWRAAGLEHITLLNTYGPTEAAVTATTFDCSGLMKATDVSAVPIGTPLGGRRVYVLDRCLELAPVGVAGELFIGGDLLARGYLGRAALTSERFIADPFDAQGGRLYRTGDRVRWNAEGQLEYLGRIDQQLKIRGFRVEPGEIEAQLLAQNGVREAIVIASGEAASARLLAYVSAQEGVEIDGAALRGTLAQTLPDYMVPAAIVVLPRLPLSPNGKVDRKALPAIGNAQTYEPPLGDVEVSLAGLWSELFGMDTVSRRDHFFELGGHSLLAVQLVSRINNAWQANITVRSIFQYPQLSDLAAHLHVNSQSKNVAQAFSAIDLFIDELEAV